MLAEVVQPCTITLEPVTTRIKETVTRHYLADMPEPEGDEIEMPEDDTLETLTDIIDVGQVMTEALALALPLYPRAEGAELGVTVFAQPGVDPLTDEAMRPFAKLADILKNDPSKQ